MYLVHKENWFTFLGLDAASNLPAGIQKLQVSTAAHLKQQELLKQVAEQSFVPKEPPPEFEFVADPPSISALDLCVILRVANINKGGSNNLSFIQGYSKIDSPVCRP